MAPSVAYVRADGRYAYRDPQSGERYWVPKSDLEEAAKSGLTPVGPVENHRYEEAKKYDNPLAAGFFGVLRVRRGES